jgi:hypothetical protein
MLTRCPPRTALLAGAAGAAFALTLLLQHWLLLQQPLAVPGAAAGAASGSRSRSSRSASAPLLPVARAGGGASRRCDIASHDKSAVELSLKGCGLRELPPSISEFWQLEKLDLVTHHCCCCPALLAVVPVHAPRQQSAALSEGGGLPAYSSGGVLPSAAAWPWLTGGALRAYGWPWHDGQ